MQARGARGRGRNSQSQGNRYVPQPAATVGRQQSHVASQGQAQQRGRLLGGAQDSDLASLASEDLPDGNAIIVPPHLRHVLQMRAQPIVKLIKYVCSFPVEASEQEARMNSVQRQLQMIARHVTSIALQPVYLSISLSGIRITSFTHPELSVVHTVRRISYAACNPESCQFAFLARPPQTPGHLQFCHTFVTHNPEEAEELHALVSNSFRMAYEQQQQAVQFQLVQQAIHRNSAAPPLPQPFPIQMPTSNAGQNSFDRRLAPQGGHNQAQAQGPNQPGAQALVPCQAEAPSNTTSAVFGSIPDQTVRTSGISSADSASPAPVQSQLSIVSAALSPQLSVGPQSPAQSHLLVSPLPSSITSLPPQQSQDPTSALGSGFSINSAGLGSLGTVLCVNGAQLPTANTPAAQRDSSTAMPEFVENPELALAQSPLSQRLERTQLVDHSTQVTMRGRGTQVSAGLQCTLNMHANQTIQIADLDLNLNASDAPLSSPPPQDASCGSSHAFQHHISNASNSLQQAQYTSVQGTQNPEHELEISGSSQRSNNKGNLLQHASQHSTMSQHNSVKGKGTLANQSQMQPIAPSSNQPSLRLGENPVHSKSAANRSSHHESVQEPEANDAVQVDGNVSATTDPKRSSDRNKLRPPESIQQARVSEERHVHSRAHRVTRLGRVGSMSSIASDPEAAENPYPELDREDTASATSACSCSSSCTIATSAHCTTGLSRCSSFSEITALGSRPISRVGCPRCRSRLAANSRASARRMLRQTLNDVAKLLGSYDHEADQSQQADANAVQARTQAPPASSAQAQTSAANPPAPTSKAEATRKTDNLNLSKAESRLKAKRGSGSHKTSWTFLKAIPIDTPPETLRTETNNLSVTMNTCNDSTNGVANSPTKDRDVRIPATKLSAQHSKLAAPNQAHNVGAAATSANASGQASLNATQSSQSTKSHKNEVSTSQIQMPSRRAPEIASNPTTKPFTTQNSDSRLVAHAKLKDNQAKSNELQNHPLSTQQSMPESMPKTAHISIQSQPPAMPFSPPNPFGSQSSNTQESQAAPSQSSNHRASMHDASLPSGSSAANGEYLSRPAPPPKRKDRDRVAHDSAHAQFNSSANEQPGLLQQPDTTGSSSSGSAAIPLTARGRHLPAVNSANAASSQMQNFSNVTSVGGLIGASALITGNGTTTRYSNPFDTMISYDLRAEAELAQNPWFQPHLPRDEVCEMLEHAEQGSFLVRRSATNPGAYALSISVTSENSGSNPLEKHAPGGSWQQVSSASKFQTTPRTMLVSHYLILRTTSGGYRLKGLAKEWPSLFALIAHLTAEREILPCKLRIPPVLGIGVQGMAVPFAPPPIAAAPGTSITAQFALSPVSIAQLNAAAAIQAQARAKLINQIILANSTLANIPRFMFVSPSGQAQMQAAPLSQAQAQAQAQAQGLTTLFTSPNVAQVASLEAHAQAQAQMQAQAQPQIITQAQNPAQNHNEMQTVQRSQNQLSRGSTSAFTSVRNSGGNSNATNSIGKLQERHSYEKQGSQERQGKASHIPTEAQPQLSGSWNAGQSRTCASTSSSSLPSSADSSAQSHLASRGAQMPLPPSNLATLSSLASVQTVGSLNANMFADQESEPLARVNANELLGFKFGLPGQPNQMLNPSALLGIEGSYGEHENDIDLEADELVDELDMDDEDKESDYNLLTSFTSRMAALGTH